MSKKRLVNTIRQWNSQNEPRHEFRRGLLGQGVSGERSARVPGRFGYWYVRNRQNLSQIWQVYGQNVPDIPGLPIILDRDKLDQNKMEIITWDGRGMSNLPGFSGSVGLIGPHHEQHEDDGWDMVNVGKRMIRPLRLRPDPASASYSVFLEWDETPYIGSRLLDLENMTGYVTTPYRGVRRTLYNISTATPGVSRFYLAVLSDEPELYFITGSIFTQLLDGLVVPPNFALGAYRPDPALAHQRYNGVPLAWVYLGATATAIRYSDIEDLRPLWSMPGRMWATGVMTDDVGGFFTGTTVETNLQELGWASTRVRVTFSDTTPNYLSSKVSAGGGISLAVLNTGGNEALQISASGFAAYTGTHTRWVVDAWPVSGTAHDDEFADGSLSVSWTEIDTGGSVVPSEESWGLSLLRAASNDLSPLGLYRSVPTGSWTAYTKVGLTSWGDNDAAAGFIFGQDLTVTTGTQLSFYGLESVANSQQLVVNTYTSYDATGSNYLFLDGHIVGGAYLRARYWQPSATLYLGYSQNGLGWEEIGNYTPPSGIQHIGLAAYNQNLASSDAARASFLFYRVSWDSSITGVLQGRRILE